MTPAKRIRDSQVITTNLVLPNDTNQLGNLLGGTLMHWIDITAAIAALRHADRVCVTASVDELNFHLPIKLGDIVTLQASVNRAFTTSMEIGVVVTALTTPGGVPRRANHAYLTFVAVDDNGNPVGVPAAIAESDDEKRRYDEAQARRALRLQHRRT